MIFFLSKFWDLRFIQIFLSSIILRIIPRSQNCCNYLSIILRSRNNSLILIFFFQNSEISDLLKLFSIILRIIPRSQNCYNFLSIILRSRNNSQNFDLFFVKILRSQIYWNLFSIILRIIPRSQNYYNLFSINLRFFFILEPKFSMFFIFLEFSSLFFWKIWD